MSDRTAVADAPRVSIGLPVYNGERFLARTLADWTEQTFESYELIVCDNASTDATADIIREVADKDSRIRYVLNERNVGALSNANKAFELSQAPYYVLSSYDDRHHPRFLEALVHALDADENAVLAYGQSTLMDDDERAFAFDPERRVYTDPEGMRHGYDARLEQHLSDGALERYRAVLASNDVNAPIHGLYKREALDRVGPHQLYGSDRLIVAHAALLGRFAFVQEPLFGFRIHTGSTLHMTRAEWLAREAGAADAGSALDGARTLAAYLKAAGRADLGLLDYGRAVRATIGYAIRPHVIRNVFLPGPDNYFGWTRAPWAARTNGVDGEKSVRSYEMPSEWSWLQHA